MDSDKNLAAVYRRIPGKIEQDNPKSFDTAVHLDKILPNKTNLAKKKNKDEKQV